MGEEGRDRVGDKILDWQISFCLLRQRREEEGDNGEIPPVYSPRKQEIVFCCTRTQGKINATTCAGRKKRRFRLEIEYFLLDCKNMWIAFFSRNGIFPLFALGMDL